MIWPWKKDLGALGLPAAVASAGGWADVLEGLVTALPDPCLVLDHAARVVVANQRLRETLDRDPKGEHISAAIRSPALLEAVAKVLRGGGAVRVDYIERVPVERRFDAHVAGFEVLEADRGALVLLRDLTREQQIERMRADFVANASHELRTPLSSLLGFIETLQGPARGDEKAREKFLELMRTQAQRMKRLIDDLLSLSRIEMNAHLRPSAKVDLAQVAGHVRDSLSGLAREAGCVIKLGFDQPLTVAGDWDELVQVAQNLVENAIKYASGGGTIDITGRIAEDMAEMTVRDYGPGIASEHLPRLTERFYRVNVQESRSRGGTGLGLAIVKHILNRHRGRLVIRSEHHAGSAFTVRIPLYKPMNYSVMKVLRECCTTLTKEP